MDMRHILDEFDEPPKFGRHKEKNTKERANGTRVFFNVVHKPNEAMGAVHEEIIRVLTERLSPFYKTLPNAISVKGVTSRSIFRRLECKRYIQKMDLFHAYGSVEVGRLATMMKQLLPSWGSVKQIEAFLRKYCCNDRLGLFYGAPASPLLFNLYCERLIDAKIRDILGRYFVRDIGYMRYIDDLIFFSRDEAISNRFLSHIRFIIKEAGFFENQWKAKGVDRKQGSIIILGRQLGCLAPALEMNWRTFSKSPNVKRKASELKYVMDPGYKLLPRRLVGMPVHSLEKNSVSIKKSLEVLEREMYRAASGEHVSKPASLVGKMVWFVESVYPEGRALSRTERKLVSHFVQWAKKTGQATDILKKLNIIIDV